MTYARSFFICVSALVLGCADKNIVIDCSKGPIELQLLKKLDPSECIAADGQIQVTARGGLGKYDFKIENKVVSDGIFSNLESGVYQVSATDHSGCIDTLSVKLEAAASKGLSWSNQLKSLITNRCGHCHAGGGRGDFSRYAEVVEYLDKIRHRVVTGSMPQDRPLEKDQVRLIICWIDAGAPEF